MPIFCLRFKMILLILSSHFSQDIDVMKKSFILFVNICVLLSVTFSMKADDMGFYSINDYRHIDILEPTSICKDSVGFLWVASRTDIIRISDTEHTIYNLPDSHRGANNFRLKYIAGRLIAFNTKGDIFQYDVKLDNFKKLIDVAKAIDNKEVYISDVIVDTEGTLWIASNSGVFHSRSEGLGKMSNIKGMVGCFVNADDGSLIMVSTNGIYKINPADLTTTKMCDTGLMASSLCFDSRHDKIWIGTASRGLFYYDFKTKDIKPVDISHFPRQQIKDIEAVSDSSIWCAIDGRGIWEVNRDDGSLIGIYQENAAHPYSIRGNGVQEIFYEKPDKVWICSFTGGVEACEMKSSPITQRKHIPGNPNSLVNNYIYDVFEDSYGNIWMGTNSGLSCLEGSTGNWINFFEERGKEAFIVRAVSEDANGNIWAGTYSHGIFVLDGKSHRIIAHYTGDFGLLSNFGFIYDIIKDGNGDMWVTGMSPEILRYHNDSIGFESYRAPVASRLVEFDDSTLILASFNKLVSFDKNTKEPTVILSDNLLEDIAVVGNKVWVAHRGNGLMSYDMTTKEAKNFDISDGIISNNINSLIRAGKELWLGTDKGIGKFNTENDSAVPYSLPFVYQSITYNPHAGIALSDGTLGWGTSDGFMDINPGHLTPVKDKGHIYIQDIVISGQSIRKLPELMPESPLDSIETLHVPLSMNNVTINLLPLRTGAHKVSFSWKMDGVDKQWSTPSETSTLNYARLTPGSHTLHMRLYHQGTVTERTLYIIVDPPFYLTWWFILAAIIVIGGSVTAFIRFRKSGIPLRAELSKESVGLPDGERDLNFESNYEQIVNQEFVERATQVVRAHLSDIDFNKDKFAQEMGVSTSLLFKKLKTTTGMSIVSFIRNVRMEEALNMIKSEGYNISEISDRCGFSSIGYFSTVFKKHFGKSPSDFRTIKSQDPPQTI